MAGPAGCPVTSAVTVMTTELLLATPVIAQGPSGTLTSSATNDNQWYFGPTLILAATSATYVVTSSTAHRQEIYLTW